MIVERMRKQHFFIFFENIAPGTDLTVLNAVCNFDKKSCQFLVIVTYYTRKWAILKEFNKKLSGNIYSMFVERIEEATLLFCLKIWPLLN